MAGRMEKRQKNKQERAVASSQKQYDQIAELESKGEDSSKKEWWLEKVVMKLSILLFIGASLFRVDEPDMAFLPDNLVGRKLSPSWCYDNMISNGNFEANNGSTSGWHANFVENKIGVIEHENGHALIYTDRTKVHAGPTQKIIEGASCFSGSGFYLQIKAKVRMYDQETGEGLTQCSHDKLYDMEFSHMWRKGLYCPMVTIFTKKTQGDHNESVYNESVHNESVYNESINEEEIYDYFDAHDTNMEWNPDGWNELDIIYAVPEMQSGEGVETASIQIIGGPANATILIDDVVLRRIEEIDLPEGHPIYDPIQPNCTEDIIRNGDGNYQSPFGWDSHGHWFSEFSLGVEPSEQGGPGYTLIASNRTDPGYQGLGQLLDHSCLAGNGFYFRIEADVQLYDEETGIGITSCSATYAETAIDCPYVTLEYRDFNWRHTDSVDLFDMNMTYNWNADSWNKVDIIVAMAPTRYQPKYRYLKINFVGGPPNSVLKIDNVHARRLNSDELPAGHVILNLKGDALLPPIKVCSSTGDPHLTTFENLHFDNHTVGWMTLYEKDNVKVEAHQAEVYEIASVNDAVRVTYKDTVLHFENGDLPTIESEYYHVEKDQLIFRDPPLAVAIATRKFTPLQYMYNVWLITSATEVSQGVCGWTKEMIGKQEEIVFPPDAPGRNVAEIVCKRLKGTLGFEDCITDFRVAREFNVAKNFIISNIQAYVRKQGIAQQVRRVMHPATQRRIPAGALGDPVILGLSNQVFKFDGKSDAWYANLATEMLQWNMKFHQFSGCPQDEDMFVTGIGIGIYSPRPISRVFDKKARTLLHTVEVKIKDEDSFHPGCDQEEPGCLGEGSLEIVVDDMSIVRPGDYYFSADGGLRIVTFNIPGECSRKWHDFKEPEEESMHGSTRAEQNRVLVQKRPIDFLLEGEDEMVNPKLCEEWIQERLDNDDLFFQPGGWSRMHIETPTLSFHIEYRQGPCVAGRCCSFHSMDTWMSKVSRDMKSLEWQGILGETRKPKHDATGKQIISDRNELLLGKMDSDYEVSGPFGTHFLAQKFNPWFWRIRGALRGI
eukprot:CAMPEP_0195532526 /NCGR_PEP_ID=MMETSP0794_2-20130614/38424_1 /TAXON_ID=515487 /ORGANISM="Stephanopyxis turris, Strain CCMP 815" /LENGTH=1057 /DNA_ID=CAMNT_0040664783 /DNA_START=62 /DNA_END=3236 /DNA_ORIENTATION=-